MLLVYTACLADQQHAQIHRYTFKVHRIANKSGACSVMTAGAAFLPAEHLDGNAEAEISSRRYWFVLAVESHVVEFSRMLS